MRSVLFLAAAILIVPTSAFPAPAAVEVTFVEPEAYTDAGTYGRSGARAGDPILCEIASYFEELGREYLRPDEHLKIEVLDIDLAGRYEPWRAFASDVRVMRDVTWPRITLRYTLRLSGVVQLEAEELVSDMAYLMDPIARRSSDRLAYEKSMLKDWFHRLFGDRRLPD